MYIYVLDILNVYVYTSGVMLPVVCERGTYVYNIHVYQSDYELSLMPLFWVYLCCVLAPDVLRTNHHKSGTVECAVHFWALSIEILSFDC